MDPDLASARPRKVKYAPKAPQTRRKVKLVIPKTDEDDKYDAETQRSLVRRANEHLERKGSKVEKKSSVQGTSSPEVASTGTTTFGKQREKTGDQSDGAYSKASPLNQMQKLSTSLPNAGNGEVAEDLHDSSDEVVPKKKKEYQEPWDYEKSHYPTTLPLRRPYSGDPELLDKAEFEEAPEYDENSVSCAEHLGLLQGEDKAEGMLFFKFGCKLPLGSSRKGKEIAGNAKSGSLEEMGEGYMGKMLVYRSGKVKLKLGDILYDVSPGLECNFPQSVMAINTTEKHCCELGTVGKTAVVTPDIDSLLQNEID